MTTRRTPPPPPANLAELVEKDKRDRIMLCQAEIAAALRRHGCRLMAIPVITQDGRVAAQLALDVETAPA